MAIKIKNQEIKPDGPQLGDQLALIINSLDDGVVILNQDKRISLVNLSFLRISGFSEKEIKNLDAEQLFKKIISKAVEEERLFDFIQNFKKDSQDYFEFNFQFHSPSHALIKFYSGPVLDKKKKLIGRLIIFRDITKDAEINQIKTEFVSIASHQLRTPLTAIKWFLEELKEERLGILNPKQKDYLEQTYDSNERMIRLVNNLLNISHLESGGLKIAPLPIQTEELIASVIDENIPLAISRNCQIKFIRPPEYLEKVSLDPSLIRQVLINLISNAIKYSKEGGERNMVKVKLERKPPDLLISIIDRGVGIPANKQAHIFDKFYRAEDSKLEGAGLGLYVAKMIIELNGGRIWFESEEGRGTTFYVSLPLSGTQPKKGDKVLI